MTIVYKALAAVLLLIGLFLAGVHVGDSRTQARWDAQKRADAIASAKVEAASQQHAADIAATFGTISDTFEAVTHEKPASIADSIPAAVAAGTLQLRDNPVCTGQVSAATSRSRAADAAATQTLADRTANAIEVVRLADSADERERQLDAQIKGLQDVLKAERR